MSIQKMTGVAVFAALVAVFSQMSLLIGPVPHTMQIFAVTLAGVVLGPKRGVLSIVVWELLGAFGLPVFAMAHGGLTSLFGPLVGFFIGFVIHAYVCGLTNNMRLIPAILCNILSLAVVYFLGVTGFWAEYNFLLGKAIPVSKAFAACAAPFIVFDIIKLALAVTAGRRAVRILKKAGINLY